MLVLRLNPLAIIAYLGLLTACSSAVPKTEDVTPQPSSHERQVAPLLAASAIGVFPSSLQFGEQQVGTTSTPQQVTVRNTGTEDLFVSDSTTTGPFAVSPAGPLTLAPGASQELSVTFSPSTGGAIEGALSFSSNDPFNPRVTVFLAGQGVMPVEVKPGVLDFGEQRVGTTSSAQRVTVSNNGSGSLVITGISTTSGPFAASFPPVPFTLAPGASQDISVTFSPTIVGTFSGTLTLTTDAPASPSVSIPIAGKGVKPDLDISPTRLAFGASNVGVSAAHQEVRFYNPSDTELRISSVSFSGTAALDFRVASPGSFPVTVSPGVTVTLPLRFTPRAVGSRQAQAIFTLDGTAQGTAVVELVGEGTSPLVAVTPDRLDFGTQRMGDASEPFALRLQNTGTGPLTLSRVELSGADVARFSLAPLTLPLTLEPGASMELAVMLNPDAVRTFSAMLVVESDDASHPRVEVPLSGKAVGGYLAVEPLSWDFGGVEVGIQGEPRTFSVTNASSYPRTVERVQSTSAAFGVDAGELQATSIAPGGSATFRVIFHPEAAGPASGEIRLTLRGESTPDAVLAVSGTGSLHAVPASGCSCNSGGGTGAAAVLTLLGLLVLSGRRARSAASGCERYWQ
ncbi:choice-of-anchor D domain-containing protein [Archangium sp.]|uniref:choice-of-anchor D domain-containing protein n=1 Tax=Archangium sp. TaxID=1872627 RepID=UPI002D4A06C5|nr:choice-of-anchor D domain-containing protein [Archangium sp.]HYO55273.1 choice-of-anchor D domain-containing protein [Archangium sp.]